MNAPEINDGGPAFPRPRTLYSPDKEGDQTIECDDGMTLRDWFAGMALQGFIACPGTLNGNNSATDKEYAMAAYITADAMIAERKKVRGAA